MSNFHKEFRKFIVNEFRPLLLSTLRNGASNIGTGLLEAVSDLNQPSDIIQSNITAALKNKAIETGQEAIMNGIEILRAHRY